MFQQETMKTATVIGVWTIVLVLTASTAFARIIRVDDDADLHGNGQT